jgi:peptidyl-prolyl cis-trans isomerase SurA
MAVLFWSTASSKLNYSLLNLALYLEMKKIILSAGVVAAALMALAAKNNDAVLMTINGRPVYQSEFEYLYNKNNAQQVQPQSLDEYVQMFVDYKLKVADAEAAGRDTTASFIKEYNEFRNELAAPYLTDTTVMTSLLQQAYSHYSEELKVSHIMVQYPGGRDARAKATATLDSLRTAILNGTAKWDDVASQYSIDRGTNAKGGQMGWIMPGRLPWPFEEAAYNTAKGEISPIVNSGYGLHIIRVDDRRASSGEVQAQHILKLTARKSEAEAAKAKEQIDSIYNVVMDGADFSDVAQRESEDPGSKSKGGMLDWYGRGMMVAEFDSASFALADGEISKPVKTSYGYHIIKRLAHRGVADFATMRPTLEKQISGDERGQRPYKARIEQLEKTYNSHLLNDGLAQVETLIKDNGGFDSLAISKLSASDIAVYEVNGVKAPVKSVMKYVRVGRTQPSTDDAVEMISNAATFGMENATADVERENLLTNNADYRNLVNEYRDGILLFDISNEKVWDRANKDKEGLEAYFNANRDKYTWDKPKFKGYVVFATNDTIGAQVRQFCDSINAAGFDAETFAGDLRKAFGRDAKVERVIAAQGDNAITDNLAFNGPKPAENTRWKDCFAFRGRIIEQPEEAADVRGQVTTDYQNSLEKEWVEQLRKTYPVKINNKVLKKIK